MTNHNDPELHTEKITTQSKVFLVDLKANKGGYYLKVSERSNHKKSSIFIPAEGIEDFVAVFQKLAAMIRARDGGNGPA